MSAPTTERSDARPEPDPRVCGHLFRENGMGFAHSATSACAFYWRRCAICGFTEYRDQNTPVST